MSTTTKAASTLTRGDRVKLPDLDVTAVVLEYRGIRSSHSPGRVGYLVRLDDGRVLRLSLPDTERVVVVR